MRVTKVVKVFLLFSIVLLLLPTTFVEAKGKPVLGVSNAYIERAGYIDIGVFIQSDEKIASGSFDLAYDSDLLQVIDRDVVLGDQLGNYLSSASGVNQGKVTLAFAKATGETFDGTLLKIRTRVMSVNDPIQLAFENAHFYDEKGKKIDVQLLNGQIKPFTGTEQTHEKTEALDKMWTITLNKSYNPATLNEHTVKVMRGTTVVDVIIEPKNSLSFTVKPKGKYIRGTYTLEISDQLRSATGGKLNEPIRHVFKVQ